MSKEKENTGEEPQAVHYKSLRLITPERANELGILAESPVFVSPQVTGSANCGLCEKKVTPLVYAPGKMIVAQHFHQEHRLGGIYQYTTKRGVFRGCAVDGWTAILQPLGNSYQSGFSRFDRYYCSEGVIVQRIIAHSRKNWRRQVSEGVIYEQTYSGNLSPIDSDEYDGDIADDIKFRFHIQETGEVAFSLLSPPPKYFVM